MKEFDINDVVETKKTHACGGKEWKVIRVGADVKIKCLECGRIVMLPRNKFANSIKKIVEKASNSEE
ncbi:DUF951 domain-containing protein [Clostridium ihumii]|uniref:DUF951 domain-containing protein n=1 Tax=Clostridium ihumii TaxID=1470356 RepID=UPI00058FBC42|nr:DUF951 domain-containing protein [Clostridium ihumii]